jgi:hypothetical protein
MRTQLRLANEASVDKQVRYCACFWRVQLAMLDDLGSLACAMQGTHETKIPHIYETARRFYNR